MSLQEIKSTLAKLLATEDLIVEHKQVETASFNVETRVLTLPLWEKATNSVYDMLVGHEVSHALFTPNFDWSIENPLPHGVVNVVEDARVEKLMKRKYLGIAKTFFNGYSELHSQDFFSVNDLDIDEMNLADRINLFFKIGRFVDISFTEEEIKIRDLIDAAETFDDTLHAAKVLNDYCEEEMDRKGEDAKPDDDEELVELEMQGGNGQGNGDGEGEGQGKGKGKGDEDGEEDPIEETPDQLVIDPNQPWDQGSTQVGGLKGATGSVDKEVEVRTAEKLEENIRELINTGGRDHVYVGIPQVSLDTIIADNQEVHDYIDESFAEDEKKYNDEILSERKTVCRYNNRTGEYEDVLLKALFEEADDDFYAFKNSAKKEVSYLVKEFECKKSADAYSRSSTARTGVLDTAKLHTYKFNEDLFKKVTIVPDGKNHGLVFILDWSGSMNYIMQDTLRQLYNLIWFCRKVQIPFEVYAFTNEWNERSDMSWNAEEQRYVSKYSPLKEHCERVEHELYVDSRFALLNILTSKTNAKTLEKQMINIWRLGCKFNNNSYTFYNIPRRLSLSGTPLNEAIVALHQIIPQFQKDNKVQKVQCVILTDGEAGSIPYNNTVERRWEDEPYMGTRSPDYGNVFLRDRKLGKTYLFKYGYHHFTNSLLENLKDKFPSVNLVGIRLVPSRDGMHFARMYVEPESKEMHKIQNDWKKSKSFTIKTSGYDAYFGLSSNTLSGDDEFTVKEDATKADIKRAFAKSLKVKKLNKRVLSEFIELVA